MQLFGLTSRLLNTQLVKSGFLVSCLIPCYWTKINYQTFLEHIYTNEWLQVLQSFFSYCTSTYHQLLSWLTSKILFSCTGMITLSVKVTKSDTHCTNWLISIFPGLHNSVASLSKWMWWSWIPVTQVWAWSPATCLWESLPPSRLWPVWCRPWVWLCNRACNTCSRLGSQNYKQSAC